MRRIIPLIAALLALGSSSICHAAPHMAVRVAGHGISTVTPGTRITVSVPLPRATHAYCLGLISTADRFGLPVNLGRMALDRIGMGVVVATIPQHIFPAEPAGPFLLLVGTCTSVAPDRPFVAQTTIRIVPS